MNANQQSNQDNFATQICLFGSTNCENMDGTVIQPAHHQFAGLESLACWMAGLWRVGFLFSCIQRECRWKFKPNMKLVPTIQLVVGPPATEMLKSNHVSPKVGVDI